MNCYRALARRGSLETMTELISCCAAGNLSNSFNLLGIVWGQLEEDVLFWEQILKWNQFLSEITATPNRLNASLLKMASMLDLEDIDNDLRSMVILLKMGASATAKDVAGMQVLHDTTIK